MPSMPVGRASSATDAEMTTVGVTGHRDLADAAGLRQAIASELGTVATPLIGISALAAGADQFFAEAVLGLGGELHVIVPGRDYRATLPPDARAAFDRQLAAATTVETLDIDTVGSDAYLAAGLAMLDRCDLLLAVWDGEQSRGRGGTADLVGRARERGIAVRVIPAVRRIPAVRGRSAFTTPAAESTMAVLPGSVQSGNQPGRPDMNDLAGSASHRAATIAGIPHFRMLTAYLDGSFYASRQRQPGVCDFAFGNPHEMPSAAYVAALRTVLEPRNEEWFAYQTNSPEAQAAASAALNRLTGIAFDPEDIHLTTRAFTAIALALKTVTDPGDEVIYSLPPWFLYEPLLIEAGLTAVKVPIDTTTFDLDLNAIAAAITPRTRVVIVNSPNNPTGRIYPPELLRELAAILEAASQRLNRRIYLLSDEAYNRIVYDGARFHSPAEYYPHTLLAYTYGKTHLAPGERIGYLALPPGLSSRVALRGTITALQISMGWIYPNATLQYALPRLEEFSIDIGLLQRKRDRMVTALTAMGYQVAPCEGTFYLFVTSPTPDDTAFTDDLAQRDVFVLPGTMFETPGFFRISLTASEEMIERSLPLFADAFSRVGTERSSGS